jgi:hypothetical protein
MPDRARKPDLTPPSIHWPGEFSSRTRIVTTTLPNTLPLSHQLLQQKQLPEQTPSEPHRTRRGLTPVSEPKVLPRLEIPAPQPNHRPLIRRRRSEASCCRARPRRDPEPRPRHGLRYMPEPQSNQPVLRWLIPAALIELISGRR